MNIKSKKILCLLIFCNLFINMGAVCALDNSGHQQNHKLIGNDTKSNNAIVINQQTSQKHNLSNKGSDANGLGTFEDLDKKIQEAILNHDSIIHLDKNYKYVYSDGFKLKNGILIKKNIIIDGNGHTIDGNGVARAFQIECPIEIKDITIKNTNSACGSAIYSTNYVDLRNANLCNNNATHDAGAIYCGSLNIVDCDFENNVALGNGGAIYSEGYVNVDEFGGMCKFFGNTADEGGAIYTCGSVNVNHTDFTCNKASENGGAIYSINDVKLVGCGFALNLVCDDDGDGGAIYTTGHNINLTHNVFTSNCANSRGGVIYCGDDDSHISLVDNGFSGNVCKSHKGSLYKGVVVFTDGYFDKIYSNWWGTPNPSWDCGLLVKNKFWSSEIHKDDSPRSQPVN